MTESYRLYLQSPEWRARREWALERASHRCQVCSSPDELDVHHRSYENLGAELPGDLLVLCRACHDLFHRGGRLHSVSPEVRAGIATALDRVLAVPDEDAFLNRSRGPLQAEMQAARRAVNLAQTEEDRLEALKEVRRVAEARRRLIEQRGAA